MMTKNVLFAVALLSVALCAGCATGGGGHTGANIQVTVKTNPANQSVVGVTLTVQFTADVTGTDNHAVTWSMNQGGNACTAACGTLDQNGLYTAPATPPTPSAIVDITATSVANPDKSYAYPLKVLPITVTVVPGPAVIGLDLQQQFSAPVTPDAAPQTVTWTITDCPSSDCGSVDANGVYTAPGALPSEASFSVQATSSIDSPNWAGKAKVTIVNSRLSGTYAFRVSGFDSSNHPIAAAGNFVANDDGTIQGGSSEDLLVAGVPAPCTILNTSTYVMDGNNHGTISLRTSGGSACTNPVLRKYKVVLNARGDGQMIEFDASGRASGVITQAGPANQVFKDSALLGSFAFGFTGSDLGGKRVGYAGVFQADGAGGITPTGALDRNDDSTATSNTGFDPTLSQYSISPDGSGTLTLVTTDTTYQFAIYVVGGKTVNATNPLTLFAISNGATTNHSAVGTIVFQDPTPIYDKSALNDFSVSSLTGVDSTSSNTLVSLTNARGDGNGNISASYDANNAGTIVAAKAFNSTYAATGNGRYTVDLLSPAVHFVLYLSAANRGFLLDQSSQAVYTGTMDQQPGSSFASAEMAGSFDAATGSSGTSGVSQVAMNLLITSVAPNFTLLGAQDETDGGQNPGQTLAGTGTVKVDGTGTITLTQPAAAQYVIYVLDNPKQSGGVVQHFVMMNVDPANTNSSIIFAER
jgi:hypothetical protein